MVNLVKDLPVTVNVLYSYYPGLLPLHWVQPLSSLLDVDRYIRTVEDRIQDDPSRLNFVVYVEKEYIPGFPR